MKRVYEWYSSLPKRIRDSITVAITTVGFISTILSILGISLGDWEKSRAIPHRKVGAILPEVI